MKTSLFSPTVFVYTTNKTYLPDLLLNRLPKNVTLFESCRWAEEAVWLAAQNAKIRLLIISPGATYGKDLSGYWAILSDYPLNTFVLVSTMPEKGISFTSDQIKEINTITNSKNIKVFTSLNSLAAKLRSVI